MRSFSLKLGLFSVIFTAVALAAITEQDVNGEQKGITCKARLTTPDVGTGPIVLAIDQDGNGLYLKTKKGFSPPVEAAFQAGVAAVLTIEKPGVIENKKSEVGFEVTEPYDRHSQTDLVACLINAVKFAREKAVAKELPIFVVGYSEGGRVAAHFLERAYRNKETFASDIKYLALMAAPMHNLVKGYNVLYESRPEVQKAPLKEAVKMTVEGKEILVRYEEPKDFFEKYNKGAKDIEFPPFGLKKNYLKDAFTTDTTTEILRRHFKADTDVAVAVYHAKGDDVKDDDDIYTFDRHYQRTSQRRTRFRFTARYYETGHGLNMAAILDSQAFFFFNLPPPARN